MSEYRWPSDNIRDWADRPWDVVTKKPLSAIPLGPAPYIDTVKIDEQIDAILKDKTLKKSYTKDKQTFAQAYIAMRNGKDVRLPEWEGYWYWDNDKNTIMIHGSNGSDIDIRDSKDMSYTMGFIIRNDWIVML